MEYLKFFILVVVMLTAVKMKTFFFEAGKKSGNLHLDELDCIRFKRIGLLASVQYIDIIGKAKEFLEKRGKSVFVSKGGRMHSGQILGCDISAAVDVKDKVDAFLLIGSGRFHALNVASLGKPVLIWQPGSEIYEFPIEEIKRIEARKRAGIAKFIAAYKIGIIVSAKPGQEKLNEALKIKGMLEKRGRKAFLFLSDMILGNELENFKIDAWVNTACPHLILDLPNAINLDILKNILNKRL